MKYEIEIHTTDKRTITAIRNTKEEISEIVSQIVTKKKKSSFLCFCDGGVNKEQITSYQINTIGERG